MKKETTYTKAFDELQQIVGQMENSQIGVDDLDVKIKRASELLKICRDKLYKTEKSVQDILDEISNYK
ncbi:MAG: exodeoxyribonuclease VII small subunit [Bacteroidetes bacterium]|nr:MAG: exodeoxyribonuclease VII small subunit [Bacteroidota bacterium]